jgi:hypothetical protein
MSKHTPGPWAVTKKQPTVVVNEGGNRWVARAFIGNGKSPRFHNDPDEAEANARLIAAAPDLLDALKSFIGESRLGSTLEQRVALATAAIASATGGQP